MIKTLRPKINFLSSAFIKKIIEEAYLVLEKNGIFVENEEAKKLLKNAGMKIKEETQKAYIKPELVEECLATTPDKIVMYDREGKKNYSLSGDNVHFNPGSAAVYVLDHETGQQRKAVTEDLISFTRLTEYLEHIKFQSTAIVSSDVPDLISDSYRLYVALLFSKKPVVTGTFRTQGFKPMYEMLVAVRGNEREVEKKPLAIFDACPSPPLKWSNLTAQSLIDCARAGIPSEIISMGMTGATSPVTIAGTLVQHVAENLSGIVISQLAKKGAPVIFGGSPSSFDMRKGTTPMGAVETMIIDSAYSQIGKHLNLPTHAYMGLSDAKKIDSQAGFESGIGAVLACLAGINVVSGPGMLNFESCQSIEKLAIDNEICGMAYRIAEGISQRDEPLAAHLFEELEKEGQFLTLEHTKRWYRKEHTFPGLVERDTYDQWVLLGKKSIEEKAKEEVRKILKKSSPSLPEKEATKEMERIMRAEAKKLGISSLPEIEN